MAEVGTAYMPVLPSLKGSRRHIEKELAGSFDGAGKAAGKSMSSGILGGVKGLAGPITTVLAGMGVVDFFKDAFGEAREAQKVGATTAQVIKATGGAAKITADQVGELAGRISAKVGVDDEAIQSGANLLLTFKNVRNEAGAGAKIFDRATAAAADLSATGFGSIEGSSKMLGKALNDPIRGISALGRAGVTFTDQQKDQIKTLVESGRVLDAQKIIMGEVESQVGGVAAASATAGEKLSVAFGNFKEDVGTRLLPVLDAVQGTITDRVLPGATRLVGLIFDKLGPALTTAGNAAQVFVGAFTGKGSDAIVPASWLNPLINAGAVVRGVFDQVLVAVRPLWPAVKSVIGVIGSYLQGQSGTWLSVLTGLLPAIQTVFAAVSTVVLTVAPVISDVIGTVSSSVQQLLPIVLPVVSTIITLVAGLVQKAAPLIGQLVTTVGGVIRTVMPGVSQIIGAVVSVIQAVLPIVQQVIGTVVDALIDNWPTIQGIFTNIGTIVTEVVGLVVPLIQSVASTLIGVWQAISPVVLPLVELIFGTIVKIIGGAFDIIAGLVKVVTGILTGDWKKAGEGLTQIIGGAWKIITALFQTARTVLTAIFGAIVTWILTRTKGFRDGVVSIFTGIVTFIRTTFNTGVNFARTIFSTVLTAVRTTVLNAINGVRGIFAGIVNWLRDSFRGSFDRIRGWMTGPVTAARDAINTALGKVKGFFSTAVTAIGKAWDGLKEKAKSPVRFVIETVINGLIGKFNEVARFFNPGHKDIPPLGLPKGFRAGGELPGTATAKRDNMTVIDSRGRARARVEPGEYIAPRWMSPLFPHLEAIRQRGRLQGFAGGGVFAPVPGRGNRHGSGYPWATWAGDYPVGMGTPVHAWKDGIVSAVRSLTYSYGKHVRMTHDDGSRSLYAHLSQILVAAGQRVAGGGILGKSGSTGRSTGPHLHLETIGGTPGSTAAPASHSGPAFDPLGVIKDVFGKAVQSVTDLAAPVKDFVNGKLNDLGGGVFADIVKSMPRAALDAVVTKIKNLMGGFAGSFGAGSGRVSGGPVGPNAARAAADWGPRFGFTNIGTYPGHDPSESRALDFMIKNPGQGNALANFAKANAAAYGLMYLIWNKQIWSVARNREGWRPYTRYGPGATASQLHTDHVHASFYAKGGRARRGLGVLGDGGRPELVDFGGGERIYPDAIAMVDNAAKVMAAVGQLNQARKVAMAGRLDAASAASSAQAQPTQRYLTQYGDVQTGADPDEIKIMFDRMERQELQRVNLIGVH